MNENEAWSLTQNGYSEHGNGGISHKQDDQSRRAGVNWCESPAAGGSARRLAQLNSGLKCLVCFPLCLGWWSKMTNMFRRLKPTSNLKGAVVVIHSVGFHKVNVWISDPDAEISSGNAPEWFTRHARFQFTGTELEDGLESLLTPVFVSWCRKTVSESCHWFPRQQRAHPAHGILWHIGKFNRGSSSHELPMASYGHLGTPSTISSA